MKGAEIAVSLNERSRNRCFFNCLSKSKVCSWICICRNQKFIL